MQVSRKTLKALETLPATKAAFIEPMECLATATLPAGPAWVWEIKLDGYRALAVKNASGVTLFSRNKKSLNKKFPYIVEALADLPEGTVVDGEVVGLDDSGRPDFNLLQNFRGGASRIYYYIFDLLCCKQRDLTRLPLVERRALLKSLVTVRDKRIRISDYVEAGSAELLAAVREQRLEGIVGKRRDSIYEPGKRTGAWIKHRVNLGQEFVIGGYFPGPHGIDSLIVGYYHGDRPLSGSVALSCCIHLSRYCMASYSVSARNSVLPSLTTTHFLTSRAGLGFPIFDSNSIDSSITYPL